MSTPERKPTILVLEPISTGSGWHMYRLETGSFPLAAGVRGHLLMLVEKLTAGVVEVWSAQPTLWIDTQPLHHDGGAKLFGAHARAWSPDMGFCFDPTGEAPRPLRMSDLMDVDYGTPPKIYDRSAILVSALSQTMPAYRLLAGRGISTLLFFRAPGSADPKLLSAVENFMQHTRAILRPLMTPGHFQSFDFYLPLLSSQSIAAMPGGQLPLTDWMGDAELYLHESFDAKEVFILSRQNLDPVFHTAGLRRSSASNAAHRVSWIFPLSSDSEEPARA